MGTERPRQSCGNLAATLRQPCGNLAARLRREAPASAATATSGRARDSAFCADSRARIFQQPACPKGTSDSSASFAELSRPVAFGRGARRRSGRCLPLGVGSAVARERYGARWGEPPLWGGGRAGREPPRGSGPKAKATQPACPKGTSAGRRPARPVAPRARRAHRGGGGIHRPITHPLDPAGRPGGYRPPAGEPPIRQGDLASLTAMGEDVLKFAEDLATFETGPIAFDLAQSY